jgi:hypothetical protein
MFRTLEEVLRAGQLPIEIIVMDEYTHDVVVADGARFLVYDTT